MTEIKQTTEAATPPKAKPGPKPKETKTETAPPEVKEEKTQEVKLPDVPNTAVSSPVPEAKSVVEPKKEEPPVVEKQEPEAAKVVPAQPVYNAASDASKSHKERILAYLDSRKGMKTVKLNDFLKSLYPISAHPHQAPDYTNQGNMKKLRHELAQLEEKREVRFVNDSYKKLGKAHFPDASTGQTYYYHIGDTPIEVEIS